jgi:signal transduction histidine kinase
MRLGLRAKILLITVLTPLTLGLATLATVHRSVTAHVDASSIHESLQHSVSVFEGMLAARGRALAGGAEVIARDPRFFSLLTLGTDQRDSRFTATVRGMARDFNRIAQTDVFEVLDRHGRRLASVGAVKSSVSAREAWVRSALKGEPSVGVMVEGRALFQVSVTPVYSDRRIVGALLLGSSIGDELAGVLREQMRSEVTFLTHGEIAGTTLSQDGDRKAVLDRFASLTDDELNRLRLGVLKIPTATATYVTVVRRIPGSEGSARELYVMQRSFDPEITFLHEVQHDLGVLGVVAVLAALLTGIVLSGSILRPIRELVRGAQEMQRGNYEHPVKVRGKDELGFLAERFMAMRQREQVYVSGLEEATRLKSEFITIASNELRTPISVIHGYRDLLEDGQLGPVLPPQQQALDAIRSSLVKLSEIAERATEFAQVQGMRIETLPVVQPVEPILKSAVGAAFAAATDRVVEISIEVEPELQPFPLDGELLAEALTHLVANAIRVTPDGGRVFLTARRRDQRLEIDVLDDGPGIAPERLGHLFDRGFSIQHAGPRPASATEDAAHDELGGGLGMVRGIVEAHGGSINASDRPEGGTRFMILIPWIEPVELKRAA